MRKTVYLLMMMAGMAAAAQTSGIIAPDSPPSAQDPNFYAQDPNVLVEIAAEGVITAETAAPVVSVMAAATEIPAFTYRLTYRAGELLEADSWTYYREFTAVDPNHPEKDPDAAFLREQLTLGPAAMHLDALAAHLEACREKLSLLEKAVRCRTAVWPTIRTVSETRSYRSLYASYRIDPPVNSSVPVIAIAEIPTLLEHLDTAGLLLSAKARYHIAQAEYEAACYWLRAALAQGRQMCDSADAVIAMGGAVNVGRALAQIEAWVQQPQSPSLFRPLGDLPRPLIRSLTATGTKRDPEIDTNDLLEVDSEFLKQSPRIVQAMERLIAALQCAEAVRLHAALNEGRLPETLAEITDVRVPLDPVTRQPFLFERKEEHFIVSSEEDGGGGRMEVRYRIIHGISNSLPGAQGFPGMPLY